MEFRFSHNIPADTGMKLKLDYSRNLTMIFKEAYSNILKHANARTVAAHMEFGPAGELRITISDNGKGFNIANTSQGNGIRNMQNRATRMNGKMEINSSPGKGTEIIFTLKNLFTETHGKQ